MIGVNKKPFVFVLMPFDQSFDDVYELAVKPACTQAGADCERVDEQYFVERIVDRIYHQISTADIIVADISGHNSNVLYETGYAHALGKHVVLLTQELDDIPFNLKHHHHIVYGGRISWLEKELHKRVAWAISEPRNISTGFCWLMTRQQVYEKAQQLVSECENSSKIRATDLYLDHDKENDAEFQSYVATIVKRIQQSTGDGAVDYRLVVAADEKGYGEKGLEQRSREFRSAGIESRMFHRYYRRNTFPLEVLIVDGSVLLGFPDAAKGHPLISGLLIHNKELAEKFKGWYDDHLWDPTK